jgi:sulfur carrier protein ThiS
MQVNVSLKGQLAEGRSKYVGPVQLPEGAKTTDLPAACGIDPRSCFVVINGVAVPRGTRLNDGDRAQLYPVQAGG